MATKPGAQRVMSGTHAMVYWDNEPVYELQSASAKLIPTREDVDFAGDMWTDSKIVGLKGEFNFKIKKVFSRAKALAEAFNKGQDPRSEIIMKLDDPDAFGAERVALHNCWFNDLALMQTENKKVCEEEFAGGFTGFDYLDSAEVQ